MQKSYTHVVIKFVARLRLPLFAKNREDPRGCWQLCYIGVNTNSSLPVTGGNTEASPRLFQDNLRSGLNIKAI